jgi:patatin-like phospholipase/acyl hydrolase
MDEPLNLLAFGAPSRTSMIFHTNLLTDGGGIRGVSMLVTLDEIMKRIQHDKRLVNPPRPCEYFHLIGGTSTGGYVGLIDHAENDCSTN